MNISARIFFTTWLIVTGSAGSPTPCFADASVTLKPDVQLDHSTVKLSDLFIGVPAEIDRDIAQAPPPCKPAIYTEDVLNKLADMYRLDWQPQASADHAVVTSACSRISSDMIREAVVARIKEDGNTKGRTFEIAFDTRNLEVDLPASQKPDFRLDNFSYDPTEKHFRTDLTAQTPRGTFILPVSGRVSVKLEVPILAHRLEAGTTISLNDLDWIEVPEEHITADVITEANQLVGREVRKDTSEGNILHSRDVMPPRLVMRGALVTLKIQTPFIMVTAQGKAQEDGAQGDTIRIVNTQSNRVIQGVVTGPDMIEIKPVNQMASAE